MLIIELENIIIKIVKEKLNSPIDDTVDGKRGKKIEGNCDKTISLNYSDKISNFVDILESKYVAIL